nr:hypothetical protein [Tanacetum cinerariifolium]
MYASLVLCSVQFSSLSVSSAAFSFPAAGVKREAGKGPHESYHCQSMNQNYLETDPCYEHNSSSFYQFQPPQYFDIHQPSKEISINELKIMMQSYFERMNQQREQEDLLAAQGEQELREQEQASQEKEKPPQNSDFHQLIGEVCSIKVCKEQKKNMEDTMLELLEVCRQKELYCMHNDVDDLIESALNSKLLSINLKSQRLDKEKQEVKNIIEQPTKCRTQPEYSLSMRDEHLSTTLETESNEIIKSNVENLVSIPSEYEGILDDTCDVPICEDSSTLKDHFEILSNSNNDDTSSDDDAFKDIEFVEASLPDSELVSLDEVNDVDQKEKEIDLEDILQIQDIILRNKLLSINRLITDIEFLNDNPTPDRVLKSSSSFPIPVANSDSFFEKSDISFSYTINYLLEFEASIFLNNHTEETSSGSTTTHADNSLPEYDSFRFKIEPNQGRLTSVVMDDISDNSTNDPLLETVDLFLVSDNSIPPGIENIDYDSEGDIYFLEELLSNDSITFPKNESSNFDHHDDLSFPHPPPKPPDVDVFFYFEPDSGELISVVMNNIDELNKNECFDLGEVRLMFFQMLKMTITFPSYLSFEFFYLISPTLRFLLYFSRPRVKT